MGKAGGAWKPLVFVCFRLWVGRAARGSRGGGTKETGGMMQR